MKMTFAAFGPLALAACSPLEPLPFGAATSAFTTVTQTHVETGPAVEYLGYRVVEPADWRGVNDLQRGN